jgi:hypothetical protein
MLPKFLFMIITFFRFFSIRFFLSDNPRGSFIQVTQVFSNVVFFFLSFFILIIIIFFSFFFMVSNPRIFFFILKNSIITLGHYSFTLQKKSAVAGHLRGHLPFNNVMRRHLKMIIPNLSVSLFCFFGNSMELKPIAIHKHSTY